tara:strand:- start:158 stop:472 length:315 start_codon:yes stop_codon:yes gene_type:complete
MKNYEDMSDIQLSVEVAKRNGMEVAAVAQDGAIITGAPGSFNINNPSDVWPIIKENGICINFRKGKTSLIGLYEECPDECTRGDEFRTAMICFLEMKDTEDRAK